MSDAVQITLIASIAPTLAALATLLVSLSNNRKQNETKDVVAAVSEKVTVLDAKADVLHVLSNDNLSKATNALAVSEATNVGLLRTLASMAESKIVADKVAERAASLTAMLAASGAEPVPVLDQIETNTAETASAVKAR